MQFLMYNSRSPCNLSSVCCIGCRRLLMVGLLIRLGLISYPKKFLWINLPFRSTQGQLWAYTRLP